MFKIIFGLKEDAYREGIQIFFSSLSEYYLAAGVISALRSGQSIERVSQDFAYQLKKDLDLLEKQIKDLTKSVEHWKSCYENLLQSQTAHVSIPLQKMLDNNMTELRQHRNFVQEAKSTILELGFKLEAANRQLSQSQADCQNQAAVIQDLNRIIARQHLQLVELLGKDYTGLPQNDHQP